MLVRILTLFLFCCIINTANAKQYNFSSRDKDIAEKVFHYIDRDRWENARFHAIKASNKVIHDLAKWFQYRDAPLHKSKITFREIDHFRITHPHWPGQTMLMKRAETALRREDITPELISWFAQRPPLTAKGMQFLAEAKIAILKDNAIKNPVAWEEAYSLIREAWTTGTFGRKESRDFLTRYGKHLRRKDHQIRIDRLLWRNQITAAKRLLKYVGPKYRKLFDARIRLKRNMRGVDTAIAAVPPAFMQDPGLIYDRARWRLRRKRHKGVQQLLLSLRTDTVIHQRKWWNLRHRQIREALSRKQYKTAYQLASTHKQMNNANFAQAEWVAGWVALRFLDSPHRAYKHFTRFYEFISFPISVSRGAYWAGRAAETSGDTKTANTWYKNAAQFNTTFYGQLALLRLDPKESISFPKYSPPSRSSYKKFMNNDLVQAAYILLQVGYKKPATHFLTTAMRHAESTDMIQRIAEFGIEQGHTDLSVRLGKQAARKGVQLSKATYPLLKDLPKNNIETALLLALIRQESAFNKHAKSRVGARGLMQLMPSTARAVARRNRIRYSKRRLLTDGQYNMRLGSHYLGSLLERFDGSYILSLAAYNAGPTNVKRWINAYGDPRKKNDLDQVIDWIEMINFSETRNYIQRILESKQVYHMLISSRSNRGIKSFKLDLTR